MTEFNLFFIWFPNLNKYLLAFLILMHLELFSRLILMFYLIECRILHHLSSVLIFNILCKKSGNIQYGNNLIYKNGNIEIQPNIILWDCVIYEVVSLYCVYVKL